MAEKQPGQLVDHVFEGLFEMLLDGTIPLGGILNEASLAERFQVSRGPVREAIKKLQGRGLVSKEPFLKARVVELSDADMVHIFQLREAVEGMSVRLATQVMSDAALDAMLADFSDAKERSEGAQALDVHVRIASSCGNPQIQQLLCDELYYLLRLYRSRSGDRPGRRGNAFSEHWQILRAMKARDADLAESLMRSHIARATRSLQDLLAESTIAVGASQDT